MNVAYKILDELPFLSDVDLELMENTLHEVRNSRYATEQMQNAMTDREQECSND